MDLNNTNNLLTSIIQTMRPKQWVKNGFLFVALFFDRKLLDLSYFSKTFYGFLLFCFISSAVYLLNDIVDYESDKAHPTKRNRPIPSGQLPRKYAIMILIVIVIIVVPLSFSLSTNFGLILTGYFSLQLLYSFIIKNIVILDVLTIASGFVLRVGAGVALVDVERFSPWLYIFTTALALFLGFAKRRQELVQLEGDAEKSRPILGEYSVQLLDYLILIVVTMSVMTYALYTFSAEGLPENHVMMLSIPFVLYGIFRYLQLIHVEGETAPPDEIVLKDRPIQVAIIVWGITTGVLLYLFG